MKALWLIVAILGLGEREHVVSPALVTAVMTVESGGRADLVGDNGEAVGAFQIHRVMVDDCNRIVGEDRWTYDDRTDVEKSRAMFVAYSRHWAEKRNDWTDEGIARRWNGGPRGHVKSSTLKYWAKIKRVLDK